MSGEGVSIAIFSDTKPDLFSQGCSSVILTWYLKCLSVHQLFRPIGVIGRFREGAIVHVYIVPVIVVDILVVTGPKKNYFL